MEPTEQTSWWDKTKGGLAELIEFVAIVGVIVLVIHYLIAEPHLVSGNSMVPNFIDGDYIITNKLATRFSTPKRGEVIILKYPRDFNKVFIKRIVGMPGERIKITDGIVSINGQILQEPYLPKDTVTQVRGFISDGEELTIPDGQYFVMGDNREGSSDSREWGPLKRELIIGQAIFRYWPLPKVGIIHVDQPSN